MVVFDLPESQRSLRARLRRTLRFAHLGCLQQSVWITPDQLDTATDRIRSLKVDTGALILFEGRPCGGENDADLASKAWDFSIINRKYAQFMEHLRSLTIIKKQASRDKLLAWLTEERARWMTCLSLDPLLPTVLLPRDYAGRKAWDQRRITLGRFTQMTKLITDHT